MLPNDFFKTLSASAHVSSINVHRFSPGTITVIVTTNFLDASGSNFIISGEGEDINLAACAALFECLDIMNTMCNEYEELQKGLVQ